MQESNKPFNKIFFEIAGYCQAHCPFCCTGNRSAKTSSSRYIPVNEFQAAVRYLFKNGLADKKTQFDLYNWGEPFLHPQFIDILNVIDNQDALLRISTNAGKYKKFPEKLTR